MTQSKSSFIEMRKVALVPGHTVAVNIYGRVFACTAATGPFEMSFNDGEFFPIAGRGVEWAMVGEDFYSRLQFKADVATEIHFYAGNFFWHENIVVPVIQAAQTRMFATGAVLNATTGIDFTTVPTGMSYRKSIVITNRDPLIELVVNCQNLASGIPPIGGWAPTAIVFPKQAWILETSDAVRLYNPGATAVNYLALEVFYLA